MHGGATATINGTPSATGIVMIVSTTTVIMIGTMTITDPEAAVVACGCAHGSA